MKQRTLKKAVTLTGVGLHSGERVVLRLSPAQENGGIAFRRTDLSSPLNRTVQLSPDLINDTRLSSTVVTDDGIRFGTIEHLMSAFCALGIDNVLVELSAPEVPIMDGSALPFIYVMQEAGIIEQKAEKRFLKIIKTVEIIETEKSVRFSPYNGFKVNLTIDFDHPVFHRSEQSLTVDFAGQSYLDEIARARTFGFMQEVELMRTHNLGLGGNLTNAIVIDETDILNPEGLRYENEFVRHKILDAIGDLYICGHPIIGAFEGCKSGHAINNALLRKNLADETVHQWVEFPDNRNLPSSFHSLPDFAYA